MDERKRISTALGADRHVRLRYLPYAVALAPILVAAAKAAMSASDARSGRDDRNSSST